MNGGIWDRAAAGYERTGVDFFAPLGRELVGRADLRPGDHVLDVGTGRGHVLVPAAAAVGGTGRVTGVDLSPAMVELTAADLAARGIAHATVRVGDAAAPGLAPASVDAVLAGFVLFLLPDPAAALRSYRSVLVPGGRLAASTYGPPDPHAEEARRRLRRRAGLGADVPDVFDDPAALAAMVTAAGFTDVVVADVAVAVRFRDAGQWWDWAWSVGYRGALERIAPADLPAARAAVAEALEPARQADGTLVITTGVRFTTALAARAA
ncbi:class I SAM-dependent methyltransferase [Jiangella sp. DSM 45060]|uniref:class I SAM-dependent methyltransferase n=1 Tax=Jiangella sp. DSM 45060 TaxID=1798224 RepID=UPI00087CBC5E|nr:class I SAM-dependent methyltransferase [Jiangella sp. DSM 45060]SDS68813.1 Ubiquinone/menaquinone biosynthesis C-methylase UbiE [Jiangella sp. DSM 45060]